MMIHTDELAKILEARDRELTSRLTEWLVKNSLWMSRERCELLAKGILMAPDLEKGK